MPNRLAGETSPYLLQHKDNPVDWFPWGDEGFQRALVEDKPVFLSIGYSSCHWCHVMERESFEDAEVAAFLNAHFVSVKVDREERPDVDEVYMAAVQLTSGRGGWPLSAFLTPDKKPFFIGTYFPKDDRGQSVGFLNVLKQISQAWVTRREDLTKAGDQISNAIRESLTASAPSTSASFDASFVQSAVEQILSGFDPENGGFGTAPKFPPHSAIEFLMLNAMRPEPSEETRQACIAAVALTLEKMCLGGIRDHVGGGFHRYSTDEKWVLPHFEKMLYDNALLLSNLVRAASVLQEFEESLAVLYLRAAQGIVEWLATEMRAPEGWFYSAVDADSEGEEGKYGTWSEAEVRSILGERATEFLSAFQFTAGGNFADEASGAVSGANIPYLIEDQGDRFDEDLLRLREVREKRVRPALDDKALVSWNGLAIGALAEAGMSALAESAAVAILNGSAKAGRLPHAFTKGQPSGNAFLDDYACLIDGLLKCAAYAEMLGQQGQKTAVPAEKWYEQAAMLAREMIELFYDFEHGGFFFASDAHEDLFGRSKPVFDQPVPSANSVALKVLLAFDDRDRTRETVQSLIGWMERAPHATEGLFAAALPLLDDATPVVEPRVKIEIPMASASSQPAPAPSVAAEVEVRLSPKEVRADSAGSGTVTLEIVVPEGFHLNSPNPPARWITPTKVSVRPIEGKAEYPPTADDRYVGRIEIPIRLKLPAKESGAEFEVTVGFQACTESECQLAVEKRFNGVIYR